MVVKTIEQDRWQAVRFYVYDAIRREIMLLGILMAQEEG